MPRPTKCRRVAFIPEVTYFKPAAIPLRALEEVQLSVEEAEAIRLKDLEGLEQEECAEKMSVSRPTFQRVLGLARQKVADALLNGKAIRIEGGSFELAVRRFRCLEGHEWDVPFEVLVGGPPRSCPTCNTSSILPLQPLGVSSARMGRGRHRGGRPTGNGQNQVGVCRVRFPRPD
ncbi:MAG: DUF134 domain-containing protein [Chloroflexota bacterium]